MPAVDRIYGGLEKGFLRQSNHRTSRNHRGKTALSLLIAALCAGSAGADERVEEVIVTAQKREENLQQVPISITAISAAQLESRGIEGGADLTGMAPNLMVAKAPGNSLISQVSIRGSSTGQPAIYVDPAVGMYVDGVYIAKSQGSLFELLDLERVEVLRGPQGTLFGRNTEAGAINFVTRKPSGNWSGSASIDLGNYGRQVQRLSMDLPKLGVLSLNLSARNERTDGWMNDTRSGAQGGTDRKAWRVAANVDVSSDFQIDYKYDRSIIGDEQYPTSLYSLSGSSGSLTSLGNQLIASGNQFNRPALVDAGNFLVAASPQMERYRHSTRPGSVTTTPGQYGQWLDVDGHALSATYDLSDNNTLKYIGSYRTMRLKDRVDSDGTPLDIIRTGRNTAVRNYSHEWQWIGHTETLDYVLGYFYYNEDGSTLGGQHIALSPPPATNKFVEYRTGDTAKALYGQLDWKATDELTLTAGMRYTRERRTNASAQYTTTGYRGPLLAYTLPWTEAAASFSAGTPTFSANYQLSPDVNVYARIAKGFRSGGFSAEVPSVAGVTTPYGPEKATTYEAGAKSMLFDQRAQLNVAIYQNKITDMQLTQLPPGSTSSQTFNAGKATLEGVELEGVFLPVDGWKVRANYGYVHAKFDQYLDHPLNATTAALAGVSTSALIDTADNRVMPYAPKHTLDLSIEGELAQTDWGALRLLTGYTYRSSFYVAAANRSLQVADAGSGGLASRNQVPGLGLLNMKLSLADIPLTASGTSEASLWMRNVTNEKKLVNMIDFGYFQNGYWAEPRTFGLSLGYKW